MRYIPDAVTERMLCVKEQYLQMPVPQEVNPYVDKKYKRFCTGDRWITLGFLEGWYQHADAPTARLRRSYAEAQELLDARPVIVDGELLTGHLYLPQYTPEEQERYEKLAEMFRMSNITLVERPPRIDHICVDFDKLLHLGIRGILEEIRQEKAGLNLRDRTVYPNLEVMEKLDFYRCCQVELEALIDLQKRYAEKARELAGAAGEPRRSELLEMAAILDRVPAEPAASFREAIQSVQFFLGTLFGLYPQGRPDRYLWSFYEKDLREGRITQALAQELIDEFCLDVSTRVFSRAACGFIVGGQDADGNLVENDLTWMFLTALDHIRMPDPNGALAVNEKTSDDLLRYAAQILSRGVTHPAFYNDEALVHSLIEYGCARRDAVNYIHSTCAEISLAGCSKSHSTPFLVALPEELRESIAAGDENPDFETLRAAYIDRIRENLADASFQYVMRMMEAGRNGNEPMRVSALVSDCIARGKSVYEGGERYGFLQPIFIGFATAVDSLIAIRHIVYEEKRMTLGQFLDIIHRDFEGEEPLRQYILHRLPHYGNDIPEADEMAGWLADQILNIIRHGDILAGDMMMPGTFSYTNHAGKGAQDEASFDGRRAHIAYSDGCSPVQGSDTNGPTAMVLSLTSWDQSAYLGGMVVNIKFTPGHLSGSKEDDFLDILRTFMRRGGMEMQVNVVDRATLEDARLHPEDHGDLIVRIGGYSDYFVHLTPAMQAEIIERTEY